MIPFGVPFSFDFDTFFMFFSKRLLETTFGAKVPIYAQNQNFGTPFGFRWAPKSAPAIFGQKGAPKHKYFPGRAFQSRPSADLAPHDLPEPPQISFLSIFVDFGRI